VLHLSTDLDLGGRERVIVELCNELFDLGYSPFICCLKNSGEWAKKLKGGIKIFELHKKNHLDLSIIKPLRDYLLKLKIEIVHAHNPGTLFYGLIAAKYAGIQSIIDTEHGFASQLSWKARFKDRLLYRYVDYITTVSDGLKDDLICTYGLANEKVQTIRNGISSVKINEEPSESKTKIGMSEEHFNIGIVARLVPVKNHLLLLKAFSFVLEENAQSRLWIVGDGELRTNLEAETRRLGIQDYVKYLGSRTDVPTILNALDLFVLCSLSEGLSITLLEAMSVGLPIVATRAGGNHEVVEDGKSGLLVKNNQVDDLAKAIGKLIGDKDLREQLAMGARKRFLDNFSVDKMAEGYNRLYHSALAENKKRKIQ
jgi:sugar transferase (PEP-CTERM/EpsH1 system associated)